MMDKGFVLRNETSADYKVVENITREAFWNHHGPGCDEHYLMHRIRTSPAFISTLDFVAELEGEVVGNIVYTKSKIIDDQGASHEVITFGPISVLPSFQGRGIGGALIEHTKRLAREMGYKAILIYGDPEYYQKFGFVTAEHYDIRTPDDFYAYPLQACALYSGAMDGLAGRFYEDDVFNIDEGDAKAFDLTFTPKALEEGLPSQLRFRALVQMRKPRNK